MLLKDYDIQGGVLDVRDGSTAIAEVMKYAEEPFNLKLRDHLAENSKKLKAKSEKMWDMVFEVIDRSKAG